MSKPIRYVAVNGRGLHVAKTVIASGNRLSVVMREIKAAEQRNPDAFWTLYERLPAGPLGVACRELAPYPGKWEVETAR